MRDVKVVNLIALGQLLGREVAAEQPPAPSSRKLCYVLRGVPGSGKSTIARTLVSGVEDGVIHSTDDLRYVDGVYTFVASENADKHHQNYLNFCRSLVEARSVVVLDNTNIKRWEFETYVMKAQDAGYEVIIIKVPHPDPAVAAARNLHNVPQAIIERMIANFEE